MTSHQLKLYLFLFTLFLFAGCKKQKDDIKVFETRIVSASLDKVVISDTTQFISDSIALDLNQDNVTDYFFVYFINSPTSNASFFSYALALNDNELLLNTFSSGYNYVSALKPGEYFRGSWGTYYGDMVNPPLDIPWENAGPRYLGFRIKANNKFYTGWLKMEIGKKGNKIIFYDYAYRLDNSNHMFAGER